MESRLVKNLILTIPLLITAVLFMFLPLMFMYALIIHFTGQYYENLIYLILFLFLFCLIDIGVGTIIDSFLHAVTDIYKDIFVNKLIESILTFAGSYIVISALDYFFSVIDLSATVKIIITAIHLIASLLFDKGDKSEDIVDESDNELYQINPVVKSEIEALLKTEMHWVDCVKLIKEKYPDIPKERIISVTRKLHMDNKNSSL
jgi:hypothetical protein